MSPLGKKKKPFVGVPAPPGYVPGLSRGESSSWSFLVLISSCPDMARGGLCAAPTVMGMRECDVVVSAVHSVDLCSPGSF